MKHYGDITKINGAEAPIVDIICGGSPCQDLSVAGKRAGLDGERSGLFMEQVRIVKEQRNECIRQLQMRGADVDLRYVKPRYMVWENVPGAFSSNKGEDFRCVLEEICRIADKTATVPLPEKGKWSNSGAIVGDGWSVAWRVHDSQFWGVPQRRRRIALVADFAGATAPEILFERKGLSGNSEQGGEERKRTSGDAEDDVIETISFQERAGCEGGARESSFSTNGQERCQPLTTKVYCLQGNGIDRAETAGCNGKGWRENQSYTLNTIDRPAVCCGVDAYNQIETGDITMSITGAATDPHHIPCVTVSQDAYDKFSENEKSASLKASGGTYGGGQRSISDTVGALCRCDYKGVGNQYVADGKVIIQDIQKTRPS